MVEEPGDERQQGASDHPVERTSLRHQTSVIGLLVALVALVSGGVFLAVFLLIEYALIWLARELAFTGHDKVT